MIYKLIQTKFPNQVQIHDFDHLKNYRILKLEEEKHKKLLWSRHANIKYTKQTLQTTKYTTNIYFEQQDNRERSAPWLHIKLRKYFTKSKNKARVNLGLDVHSIVLYYKHNPKNVCLRRRQRDSPKRRRPTCSVWKLVYIVFDKSLVIWLLARGKQLRRASLEMKYYASVKSNEILCTR